MLGLYCCASFSLVAGSGDFSLVAVRKLLIVVASFVAERGLKGMRASVAAACGLSSWGSLDLEHRLNSCDSRA